METADEEAASRPTSKDAAAARGRTIGLIATVIAMRCHHCQTFTKRPEARFGYLASLTYNDMHG